MAVVDPLPIVFKVAKVTRMVMLLCIRADSVKRIISNGHRDIVGFLASFIPPTAHHAINIPVAAKKTCCTHASDLLK